MSRELRVLPPPLSGQASSSRKRRSRHSDHASTGAEQHGLLSMASTSWKVSSRCIHPLPIGKNISPSAIQLILPESMNIQPS